MEQNPKRIIGVFVQRAHVLVTAAMLLVTATVLAAPQVAWADKPQTNKAQANTSKQPTKEATKETQETALLIALHSAGMTALGVALRQIIWGGGIGDKNSLPNPPLTPPQ